MTNDQYPRKILPVNGKKYTSIEPGVTPEFFEPIEIALDSIRPEENQAVVCILQKLLGETDFDSSRET